jgi:hypothetical protein
MQRCSVEVGDLVEAHQYASCFMHALIMEPNSEDWRGWIMHISDDAGYEILTLPFASMLGKPH